MSDLKNRLRGQYKVGPDGEFGSRSFADFIPPISIEAADRIELLENALKGARKQLMERNGLDREGDRTVGTAINIVLNS